VQALEAEIKDLIITSMSLEDIGPDDIDAAAPLFNDGLGLDSIDALELALAIQSEFGVRTEEHDERNREYFRSVGTLASFIRSKQAQAGGARTGSSSAVLADRVTGPAE
jgi:acyl carrier protein